MSTTDPTNNMTAVVPGVPMEAAVEVLAETLGKHRYIDTWGDYEEAPYTRQFGCTCGWEQNIAGMNGWTSWLAAHQSHVAEHLATAALPSLREVIAAEALAPVRDRLLESEWQAGYVAGNNDALNGTTCGRRAAAAAPVQAAGVES